MKHLRFALILFTLSGIGYGQTGLVGSDTCPTSPQQWFNTYNASTGNLNCVGISASDVPTLNQNTSGTAANLSGTPALPNGTTATTQSPGSNDTKLATDAYADAIAALKANLASPTFTGTVTMPAPTLNNVTGSTQCLHVNSSGVVSGTSGVDCGAAATAVVNMVTNAAQTAAVFLGCGGAAGGTESNYSCIAPAAMTLSHCSGVNATTQTSSNGLTWTLRKCANGGTSCSTCATNGTVQMVFTANAAGTAVTDNTHSCTLAQGDRYDLGSSVVGTPVGSYYIFSCQVQ